MFVLMFGVQVTADGSGAEVPLPAADATNDGQG